MYAIRSYYDYFPGTSVWRQIFRGGAGLNRTSFLANTCFTILLGCDSFQGNTGSRPSAGRNLPRTSYLTYCFFNPWFSGSEFSNLFSGRTLSVSAYNRLLPSLLNIINSLPNVNRNSREILCRYFPT